MDIVNISRDRRLDNVYPYEDEDGLLPVSAVRSKLIRERGLTYEDFTKWDVAYRVTISPQARRKYEESLKRK